MMENCRSVCVVGSGTIGVGIAAHLANLGFNVNLLDADRQAVEAALDRARRAFPPAFYVPATADRIRVNSLEGGQEAIANADWVCEALPERPEQKQDLYRRIEPLLREDAVLTTATNALCIARLGEALSERARSRFMGTHFLNPPRYLKLVELIPAASTNPAATRAMTSFLEGRVGRRVVVVKDTPGFVAARFGVWSQMHAVHLAERLGLTLEQVDAIAGPLVGHPRTACFQLNDLIGIDAMADVAATVYAECPEDPYREELRQPRSFSFLLERGWTGNKIGQGYYRRSGKDVVPLDLRTLAYREPRDVDLPSLRTLAQKPLVERLTEGLQLRDEVGEFLREHLIPVFRYANYLRGAVGVGAEALDRIVRWGYGWEMGPFETIDAIGAQAVGIAAPRFYRKGEALGPGDDYVPRRHEPAFFGLADYPLIEKRDGYNLRELPDDVIGIGISTERGLITQGMVSDLLKLLKSGKMERLVIGGEGADFSAGLDLRPYLAAAQAGRWDDVYAALQDLQELGKALRKLVSVAAVNGVCLGAGFELAASCSTMVVAAEAEIGFTHAQIGLIPAGGGTAMMRLRGQGSAKALSDVARRIVLGQVAKNAEEGRAMGYVRREDLTVFHPDRVVGEAIEMARVAYPQALPDWVATAGPVAGIIDQAIADLKRRGELTAHGVLVSDKLKAVLVRSTGYEDALARERAGFAELLREGLTQTRIKHLIETGRPLRN